MIARSIGASLTAISYRGMSPALNDLPAGQVDLMCDQVTNTLGQIKAGKINAYCVAAAKGSTSLPMCRPARRPALHICKQATGSPFLDPRECRRMSLPNSRPHFGKRCTIRPWRNSSQTSRPPLSRMIWPRRSGCAAFSKVHKWKETLNAMHVAPE